MSINSQVLEYMQKTKAKMTAEKLAKEIGAPVGTIRSCLHYWCEKELIMRADQFNRFSGDEIEFVVPRWPGFNPMLTKKWSEVCA